MVPTPCSHGGKRLRLSVSVGDATAAAADYVIGSNSPSGGVSTRSMAALSSQASYLPPQS